MKLKEILDKTLNDTLIVCAMVGGLSGAFLTFNYVWNKYLNDDYYYIDPYNIARVGRKADPIIGYTEMTLYFDGSIEVLRSGLFSERIYRDEDHNGWAETAEISKSSLLLKDKTKKYDIKSNKEMFKEFNRDYRKQIVRFKYFVKPNFKRR